MGVCRADAYWAQGLESGGFGWASWEFGRFECRHLGQLVIGAWVKEPGGDSKSVKTERLCKAKEARWHGLTAARRSRKMQVLKTAFNAVQWNKLKWIEMRSLLLFWKRVKWFTRRNDG
jgi:hypothetical protein